VATLYIGPRPLPAHWLTGGFPGPLPVLHSAIGWRSPVLGPLVRSTGVDSRYNLGWPPRPTSVESHGQSVFRHVQCSLCTGFTVAEHTDSRLYQPIPGHGRPVGQECSLGPLADVAIKDDAETLEAAEELLKLQREQRKRQMPTNTGATATLVTGMMDQMPTLNQLLRPMASSNPSGEAASQQKRGHFKNKDLDILMPEEFAHRPGQAELEFGNLSLQELALGSIRIITSGRITESEQTARLNHLADLMIHASSYQWPAVRAFWFYDE
jgi:hypothetical protein